MLCFHNEEMDNLRVFGMKVNGFCVCFAKVLLGMMKNNWFDVFEIYILFSMFSHLEVNNHCSWMIKVSVNGFGIFDLISNEFPFKVIGICG